MPEFVVNALPGAVMGLLMLLFGVVAYRRLNTKQLSEIQAQVVTMYQAQSAIQKEEIAALKEQIARCQEILTAITAAMRHLGIEIEVDGAVVALIKDETAKRTRLITVNIEDATRNKDKEGA